VRGFLHEFSSWKRRRSRPGQTNLAAAADRNGVAGLVIQFSNSEVIKSLRPPCEPTGRAAARPTSQLVVARLSQLVIARLDRANQYAEASRFHFAFSGMLDRPPSRTMTTEYVAPAFVKTCMRLPAAQMRPSCCANHPQKSKRAQGRPGASSHPRSACIKSSTRQNHRCGQIIRPSLRNGFNGLCRALPGDRALLPPSSLRSLLLKNLAPASGRQDHTPWPSASSAVVYSAISVHRTPRSTSVTIAKRPSDEAG